MTPHHHPPTISVYLQLFVIGGTEVWKYVLIRAPGLHPPLPVLPPLAVDQFIEIRFKKKSSLSDRTALLIPLRRERETDRETERRRDRQRDRETERTKKKKKKRKRKRKREKDRCQ